MGTICRELPVQRFCSPAHLPSDRYLSSADHARDLNNIVS
jgi:hypothetical protein